MKKRLKKKLSLRTNYHYTETTSKVKKDKMLVNDSDKEELKPIQPKKPNVSIKETEKKLKLTHKKDPEPTVKIKEKTKKEMEEEAYAKMSADEKIEYLAKKLKRSGAYTHGLRYDYDIRKRSKKPTMEEMEAYVKVLEERYRNREAFFNKMASVRVRNAIMLLDEFGFEDMAKDVEKLSEVMNFKDFDAMIKEIEHAGGKINLWESDQKAARFSPDMERDMKRIVEYYKKEYGIV